jgi:hypothetical protein
VRARVFYQFISTTSDSAVTHGADGTFLLRLMEENNYFKIVRYSKLFNWNLLSLMPIQAVTLLTFIWDVPRPNVGSDIDYPYRGFSGFPQTFPANAATEPQTMQSTAPYQIFILGFALYLIIRRYAVQLF